MSARNDAEALLEVVMPFAEKMLVEYAEFYPYGAAMKPDGEIVSVAGYDGRERPPSADLIDLLRTEFRQDARAGRYKATAIAYDVRITNPGSAVATDAIAIAVDHSDDYSVVVFYPYVLTAGTVRLGEPFAERGESSIFGD